MDTGFIILIPGEETNTNTYANTLSLIYSSSISCAYTFLYTLSSE